MPMRMKSSMWLLDPRPDLPTIVRAVEQGFELSEASNAPVMLELRIRACHVTGEFAAKDNRRRRRLRASTARRPAPLRLWPPRPSAGDLRSGAPQGRGAAAGRAAPSSATTGSTSDPRRTRRHRHHRHGRPHQRSAARAGTARPRRCVRRHAGAAPGAQRGLSPGARGAARASAPASAPCWWSRKASPNTSSRPSTWSCAAPTSRPACSARDRCRRRANTLRRYCSTASPPSSPRRRPAGVDADALVAQGPRHPRPSSQGRAPRLGESAAAAARLLHRLPGAPGVQRHQADAARARADPYQRRHRLPLVRDLAAVQHGQLHPRLRHVARQRRCGRPQHGEARRSP